MNKRIGIVRMLWIACLLIAAFQVPRSYAQQTTAAAAGKEEFLDAIKAGEIAKVRDLLKGDPSLGRATTPKGTSAILLAVYAGHKDIAEILLASGIEPNIFEAAATGRVGRVRELLKKNPELVRAYSADGWTALHLNFGNEEVAKLLLDSGADIDAVSINRLVATTLQGAAVSMHLNIARLLIARGAKINTRGEGGGSPLHEAAGNGQIEMAQLLIEHGADVNAKDDDGKTPLATAIESKKTEMAKFLRDHGAKE